MEISCISRPLTILAEGRARYDLLREGVPMDDEVPPQVLEMSRKRERAA